jgi:hypothetical protein
VVINFFVNKKKLKKKIHLTNTIFFAFKMFGVTNLFRVFTIIISFICITTIYNIATTNTQYFNFRNFTGNIEFDKIIHENCPVNVNEAGYSCLEKLRQFKIEPEKFDRELPMILHHTFWKVEERSPHHLRVMSLQILSFLATQDLNYTKLIVWVQQPFEGHINKMLDDKFSFYLITETIQVRVLDFKDLCENGLYKKYYYDCLSTVNENPVAYSDFIRFLVLYKYGGIYTDGDVLYLRDMRPFWKKNFVYRWSFARDYNTAIMGLQRGRNRNIDALYDAILGNNKRYINLVGSFYPAKIKNAVWRLNKGWIYNYTDFEVYHSIIFDPAWLCNDGVLPRLNNKTVCVFREFYDTVITAEEFDFNKFYGGAFSVHLHLGNCGKCQIGPKSFFYHFENYFRKKVKHLVVDF